MIDTNMKNALIALAVILGLTILQSLINIRRINRSRQAVMRFVSIAAALIGTVAAIYVYARMENDVVSYNEHMRSLGVPFTERVLDGSLIFYLNAAIMGVFLLLKAILCPILNLIGRKDSLTADISSTYYEKDEGTGLWLVLEKWAGLRKLLFALMIAAALTTAGLMAATCYTGSRSAFWPACFPAAALIVLIEFWCFLNGMTRSEYYTSIDGDDSSAQRISNFHRIREIYEKMFPGQLLTSHLGSEFSEHRGATELLRQFEESADPVERDISRYFQTSDEGRRFSVDCIRAVSDLMHGKSVVFFNPFYRDLEVYLMMPMVDALLKGKKCLIIAGRGTVASDAAKWAEEETGRYFRLKYLWRVKELNAQSQECEIGVLSFRQIYDVDVMNANADFFSDVGFVLMLEPSVVVNTGQAGLSILADEIRRNGNEPVFCICDRDTDGLIDTMSHVLKVEITNVVAPPVPRCIYTGMSFKANGDYIRQKLFDKQSQYLGNGIELAAVAIKNQIPRVTWYSETKAPLRDIRWIAGQYFDSICRYMNVPIQQQSLDEKIRFVPNLWSTKGTKEQFLIVEDEFCNIFSTMRAFLSRGTDQVFVNVLSENYLLRDYMRCNEQIFMTNPGAVPSLVPDYVRTERNVLLKLVLKMSSHPVKEDEIREDLSLSGCSSEDVYREILTLLERYTFADKGIVDTRLVNESGESLMANNVCYYSIPRGSYYNYFGKTLKSAFFLVEDEERDASYIDARMFGHVTQLLLPGQFLTYEGKYYRVRSVTPENGVILRRASDLYSGRKYYRQLRAYTIHKADTENLLSTRQIGDMRLDMFPCSFSVHTEGYLEMEDLCDLRSAREISFNGDPEAENYQREYRNKTVMRIALPNADEKIRFTIALLLNEFFRSVFPDAWQYIAVLAKFPEGINGMLTKAVYSIDGMIEDDSIYVIEDSGIDLGLIDAVEKNLPQLLELVTDFLEWHFEKMREPERKDPEPPDIDVPSEEELRQRTMRSRLHRLFAGLFGRKEKPRKEEKQEEEPAAAQTPSDPAGEAAEPAPEKQDAEETETTAAPGQESAPESTQETKEAAPARNPENPDDPEKPETEYDPDDPDRIRVFVPGETDGEGTGTEDEDELIIEDDVPDNLDILMPIPQTRYQKECFLKFGFDEIDSHLALDELRAYLNLRGWTNSNLRRARKRDADTKNPFLDVNAVALCDFCGVPLSGVSFERLNDGRIRCGECAMTAINTAEEFRELYFRVFNMLCTVYGIDIRKPITVKTTDAKTIAKMRGRVFIPTPGEDGRILGFARDQHGHFSLFVENGSPRLAAADTISHELTHIWQYINWKDSDIFRIYTQATPQKTQEAVLIVYEGMAMWSAIQLLYAMGETAYARKQEQLTELRKDAYGVGFRIFRDTYPFVRDGIPPVFTPFTQFPPVDPNDVKRALQGGD